MDQRINVLSLAVLAFAVEDMNERESVMTSASPWAFLCTDELEETKEKRGAHFWSR